MRKFPEGKDYFLMPWDKIFEIQENSKSLCKQTKSTLLEDLGEETYLRSQNLLKVRDRIGFEKGVYNLQITLSDICAKIPEKDRFGACSLQKRIYEEPLVEDKLPLINEFLREVSSQMFFYNIHIGGEYMGDNFENIQNATIINRSIVENSFNKVKEEHNEELAFALLQIAEFIEKSNNKPAGILFDQFSNEIHKSQPDKSTLREIWGGIEKTLPSIATISEIVTKISPILYSEIK